MAATLALAVCSYSGVVPHPVLPPAPEPGVQVVVPQPTVVGVAPGSEQASGLRIVNPTVPVARLAPRPTVAKTTIQPGIAPQPRVAVPKQQQRRAADVAGSPFDALFVGAAFVAPAPHTFDSWIRQVVAAVQRKGPVPMMPTPPELRRVSRSL